MGINQMQDLSQVCPPVEEVELVDIDGEHTTFVVVIDEIVVECIQVF